MARYDDEPPAPPYSADLLSDLHAGVLPESVSARLWPLVRRDPQAMAVISALDEVTAGLAALGRDDTVGSPIPPQVADRINRALAAESSAPSNVVPLRPRRKTLIAAASVAAAAAVVVALAVIAPGQRNNPDAPTIALPSSPAESTLVDLGSDLRPGQLMSVMGAKNLGPLEADGVLPGCLQANGIDGSRPLLGSGEVRLNGSPGVLLLLAGPRPPQITALVVGPNCSTNDPDTLAVTDIG